MNEKQFRETLRGIAADEVPAEVDLWPAIERQARLARRPAIQPRRTWHLARVTAGVVLLMLVFSASAFAFYQAFLMNLDPGMEAVREAELITELGMSQTIDGVTLTLDWAYADANRLVIGYSTRTASENTPPEIFISGDFLLTDDAGRIYHPRGGGGGGGGDLREAMFIAEFEPPAYATEPEELRLSLEVYLASSPAIAAPSGGNMQPPASAGGGGGGGGGSGSANAVPESTGPDRSSMTGPFAFEITLPFIPTTIIADAQSVTAGDITITLRRVAITPSMIAMQVCYAPPASADPWGFQPRARLTGGEIDARTQGAPLPDAGQADAACYENRFPVPMLNPPETLTLTIDQLQTGGIPTVERLLRFKDALAEAGIEIELTLTIGQQLSYHYNILAVREGVSVEQATEAAFDAAMRDVIRGPWVFTVDLP